MVDKSNQRSKEYPRYSQRVIDSSMRTGGPRVVGTLDSAYDLDPDFAELYVEYVRGEMYSRTVLDRVTRELCACAALTALDKQMQLEGHMQNALWAGATRAQVLEAIVQMVVYAGFPAVLTALKTFRKVCPPDPADRNRAPKTSWFDGDRESGYYQPAIEAGTRLYGEEYARSIIDRANKWDKDFGWAFQRFVYGGMYNRAVVDVKTRQLLAVAGCVVTNALPQLDVMFVARFESSS